MPARALIRSPLILAPAFALLAGCASTGGPTGEAGGAAIENDPQRETVIETALGQVGRPYRYGGDDPSGFDCSGLVDYSYAQAGIKLPRNTVELLDAGSNVSLDQARPGDLLFFTFAEKAYPSLHVAIYLGDGQMVHSPSGGKQVSVSRADQPPWPQRFIHAVRILP